MALLPLTFPLRVCVQTQHIMIDLGTGNNNKINWAIPDKQEVIDIIETVYRGARKGRGLVVSPKDYSTKYRCAPRAHEAARAHAVEWVRELA